MKASQSTKKWFNKVKNEHEKLAKRDDYYRHYVFEKKTGAIVGQIGFKHLCLNRLEAAINLDNKISIKLAKSIGLKAQKPYNPKK